MPHVDWPALWANLIHFGAPGSDLHPVSLAEKLVRPVVVYLVLVFALRTVGKRVLAQLNPFDFVVLLMLSNTVQNAIIGNDTSLSGGLVGAAALLGVNALLVRIYYRGPSMQQLSTADRDICLIDGGRLQRARAAPAPDQRRRAHRQGPRARVRLARRGRERRAVPQRHHVLPRARARQRAGPARRGPPPARRARRAGRGAPPVAR